MMNELINAETLTFCKTCGRILYLAEEDVLPTRRTAREASPGNRGTRRP